MYNNDCIYMRYSTEQDNRNPNTSESIYKTATTIAIK